MCARRRHGRSVLSAPKHSEPNAANLTCECDDRVVVAATRRLSDISHIYIHARATAKLVRGVAARDGARALVCSITPTKQTDSTHVRHISNDYDNDDDDGADRKRVIERERVYGRVRKVDSETDHNICV